MVQNQSTKNIINLGYKLERLLTIKEVMFWNSLVIGTELDKFMMCWSSNQLTKNLSTSYSFSSDYIYSEKNTVCRFIQIIKNLRKANLQLGLEDP